VYEVVDNEAYSVNLEASRPAYYPALGAVEAPLPWSVRNPSLLVRDLRDGEHWYQAFVSAFTPPVSRRRVS